MDEQVPLVSVCDLLLPAELQAELCITGLTASTDGMTLQFRLDPGRAYARDGYIHAPGTGLFMIGIRQCYLPVDQPEEITSTHGVTIRHVAEEVRSASARAYDQTADKPHWRQACEEYEPGWSKPVPGVTPGAVLRAAETAARQAKKADRVIYVGPVDGGFSCGDNPPDAEMFLSVTPPGLWSAHTGIWTYPVEGIPNASAFIRLHPPADLPVIRFSGRPAGLGGDGSRLSGIDIHQLYPGPAEYRGPNPPSRFGRTP